MNILPTWGGLRAALAFLTRVPVGERPLREQDMRAAPSFFPVVGGALGLLATGVYFLAMPLSDLVAAVLSVAATVYVTGAFHEDGLADTSDALGGAVSREKSLEILKDSRIGSYGTVALVLGLLARVGLISELRAQALFPLVACHCLARLAPLWLMTHLPHAAPNASKSKDILVPDRRHAYVGLFYAGAIVLIAWCFDPAPLLRLGLSLAVVAVVSLWFALLSRRRLGGITGDILGASEQVAEVGILAVFVWSV